MTDQVALRNSQVCAELLDDCPQCAAEAAYKLSVGHSCGLDSRWTSICEVFGRSRRGSETFHRISHQPVRCAKCHAVLRDNLGMDRIVSKPCVVGWCERWLCPDCGEEWASTGPVTCPVCSGYRYPHLRRMRSAYRRRRRYW